MSSTNWPPQEGLTTPVVPRKDAIITTSASINIQAPAAQVFSIVLNTAEYPGWNSFVPRATIISQPEGVPSDSKILHNGTSFAFHVVMDSNKPEKVTNTQLRITDISTPENQSDYIDKGLLDDPTYTTDLSRVYRVAWKIDGGFAARGLRTERFHEVIAKGEDECEVRTWELEGGLLARTVKWLFQNTLKQKFQDWCDDLKRAGEEIFKGKTPTTDDQN